MKIYISLPIADHYETVKSRYNEAAEQIKKMFPWAQVTGPHNINDFDEDGYHGETTNSWEWHIGEDTKALLACDAIYMTKGWAWSRGCRIERAIMAADNKAVYFADDASEKLDDE